MGLFDDLVKSAKASVESQAKRTVNKAITNVAKDAKQAIGKGLNKKEKFIFTSLPSSVGQLKAMPEASLDSAFKTAALTMAVLCNYKNDPATTFAMLDVLKGPEPLNPSEKQFLRDRLGEETYKPFSFFEGSNPENEYTPNKPYTITVMANPYSFDEENWATLYVQSSGADAERPIKFRRKPSTNQWFLNDIQCLAQIKVPTSADPWA